MCEFREDVAAVRERDPAARSVGTLEILTSYAGVHAIFAHRLAHALYDAGVPIVPRVVSNMSRSSRASRSTRPRRSAANSLSTTGPGS